MIVRVNAILTLILLVGIITCSCVSVRYVEPGLESYVQQFLTITETYCKSNYRKPRQILIYKTDLPENIVGLCTSNLTGFTVRFDRKTWDSYSESDRYQLAIHEFSHCFLDINHSIYFDNYMFGSMNHSITKEDVNNQLIDNLKTKCP